MQTTTHSIDISALGRDKRSLSLANETTAIEPIERKRFSRASVVKNARRVGVACARDACARNTRARRP